jgi:hypothetical protein
MRKTVANHCKLPEDYETAPLGAVVTWYRKAQDIHERLKNITGEEVAAMETSWMAWIDALAQAHNVPTSWLAYSIATLALSPNE